MGRNHTHCRETASTTYREALLIWDGWALIPEFLVIFSFVTLFSLYVYFSKQYDRSARQESPSLFSLVVGKGDIWLKEERGIAALHYIHFQRMMFFTALLYLVISCISLFINLTGNQMGEHIYFHQTTITNLSDNSPLHYYNIVASFLLPWLVLAVVIKFMSNCDIMKEVCSSCQGSSTLVMEGLIQDIPSDSDIKQYYSTVYPKFQLVNINRVHDTRYLRKLLRKLDWIINLITFLKSQAEVDSEILSVNEEREFKLKMEIRKEQANLRKSNFFVNIVFLTFCSSREAENIMIMEDLSSNGLYSSVKQAPCPHDIIWGNMRNPSATLIISSVNIFFILVVSCLGTFPTAFSFLASRYIEKIIDSWSIGKRVISLSLFHLYAYLMPFKIKIFQVKYGPWSLTAVISTYMTRLFFWLLMTIIIFPVFLLYNIEDIVQFLLWMPLFRDLVAHDEDEATTDVHLFQCLLVPSSGAFFINFLTMSALYRNQMQLHRIGDVFHELWMAIRHPCSKAERKAARMLSKSYSINRNTYDNMALCVNYTWCNVHFSILSCFCLICPLVSPIFLLYLAIKHLVDLQNFRVCYYAKERQPVLIRTAAKLMIFSPLLCQIIQAVVQFTNEYQVKNSSLSLTAGTLLLVNFLFFLIMHSSGWTFPGKVIIDDCNDAFCKSKQTKRRHYRGVTYEDPALTLII